MLIKPLKNQILGVLVVLLVCFGVHDCNLGYHVIYTVFTSTYQTNETQTYSVKPNRARNTANRSSGTYMVTQQAAHVLKSAKRESASDIGASARCQR